MLFIIYIDDITYINKSSVFIFADDTKLVKRVSSQEDLSDLQIDLENLLSWCKEWNLSLNTSKCRHMHFGPNYHSHTYSLGNTPILSTESFKDLGITVHKSLSWSPHVNEICKKAYSSLHLIRRSTQPHHNSTTKRKLYVSLVRANLTYCSQLWRPRLHKNIAKIEQIQRRATKYILNINSSMDYKLRLIEVNLLPLMFWYELQDILFAIKCFIKPSDNFNLYNYVKFSEGKTQDPTLRKN